MLTRLSLRARLTLLSAAVMLGVSALLTAVTLVSANRIFVKDMPQAIADVAVGTNADGAITFTPNDSSLTQLPNDGFPLSDYTALSITLKQAGHRFNLWTIAGLGLVTLLGVGAAWIMAGRALGPVRELSEAIEEMGSGDFSRRVELHGRQDEIGRLAHSFNGMMDKVSASFARQKRFSASAAHELKTPLSTIQVGLEVLDLDDQPDVERMKRALDVTRTNTARMIGLMDDLLHLSADERCGMEDEVAVQDLFGEVLSELAALRGERRVTASADAPPGLMLTGSRTLLYRAIFNLAENAVKYNREGGSISLEAEQADGAAVLRVADTGIGVAPGELQRIFEPFYRVDPSRSRATAGSGLGLALVRDIVERHGGSIQADSLPGEGTVFTLRFPWEG